MQVTGSLNIGTLLPGLLPALGTALEGGEWNSMLESAMSGLLAGKAGAAAGALLPGGTDAALKAALPAQSGSFRADAQAQSLIRQISAALQELLAAQGGSAGAANAAAEAQTPAQAAGAGTLAEAAQSAGQAHELLSLELGKLKLSMQDGKLKLELKQEKAAKAEESEGQLRRVMSPEAELLAALNSVLQQLMQRLSDDAQPKAKAEAAAAEAEAAGEAQTVMSAQAGALDAAAAQLQAAISSSQSDSQAADMQQPGSETVAVRMASAETQAEPDAASQGKAAAAVLSSAAAKQAMGNTGAEAAGTQTAARNTEPAGAEAEQSQTGRPQADKAQEESTPEKLAGQSRSMPRAGSAIAAASSARQKAEGLEAQAAINAGQAGQTAQPVGTESRRGLELLNAGAAPQIREVQISLERADGQFMQFRISQGQTQNAQTAMSDSTTQMPQTTRPVAAQLLAASTTAPAAEDALAARQQRSQLSLLQPLAKAPLELLAKAPLELLAMPQEHSRQLHSAQHEPEPQTVQPQTVQPKTVQQQALAAPQAQLQQAAAVADATQTATQAAQEQKTQAHAELKASAADAEAEAEAKASASEVLRAATAQAAGGVLKAEARATAGRPELMRTMQELGLSEKSVLRRGLGGSAHDADVRTGMKPEALPLQLAQFSAAAPLREAQGSALLPAATLLRISAMAAEAQRSGDGEYRATLRLDPPSLGRVEVSIVVQGNTVAMQLSSGNGQARRELRESAAALRQSLTEAGLSVADIEVVELASGPAASDSEGGRGEGDAQRHSAAQEHRQWHENASSAALAGQVEWRGLLAAQLRR